MDLQPLASAPSGPNDRETPVGDPFNIGGPQAPHMPGDGEWDGVS